MGDCIRIIVGGWLVVVGLLLAPAVAGASSIDALLQQAESIRSSDTKEFQRILNQLEQKRQEATPGQREHLDYLQAYSKVFTGQYDKAIRSAARLLDSASNIDMEARAGALIVNAYTLDRQFSEGLRQLEKTLSHVDKVKDPAIRHHVLGVATLIYNQIGQYGLAKHYAEQILSDSPTERIRCLAGQTRMEALQHLGQLPEGDDAILQVIALCNRQGEIAALSFARITLARKWMLAGREEDAVDLLNRHLQAVKATRYPYLIGEWQSLLAELQLKDGNIKDAEASAKSVISLDSRLTNARSLALAYKTMYEIAEHRHDIDAAFANYRRYAESNKDYLNDVKARELAYQIVRHESLRASQEIELLNRKNQVLQLQQRVSEQKAQSQRLLILLLVVLVGSIGYWAFKIKRVQVSLRRMAETDALTGICNRHHFTQQSAQTLVQSARAGEDVALVMFDLDHFKSINDRFGHDVGDWVLKRVTETCKTFCRRIDHLGRIGGEEFAILLSGCDLRGATRVAEDCRVRIAMLDTQPSGHKFLVTASFGVTASSLSGYDLAKLLSHADKMLYRAKREGRNRVCTFVGDPQQWLQLQPVPVDGQEAGQGTDAAESLRLLNS